MSMKYRTEGKPAPDRLVILHGFLNTWSAELDIEDLATVDAADTWLRKAGLWTQRKKISAAEVAQLQRFRKTLRLFVLGRDSEDAVAAINEFAADIGFTFTAIDTTEVTFEPTSNGLKQVVGYLLAIVHASIANGTWSRFKCCELETCGWAFYDTTKNRSGRWCSMKTCGSRHKAREYLKRKAQKH